MVRRPSASPIDWLKVINPCLTGVFETWEGGGSSTPHSVPPFCRKPKGPPPAPPSPRFMVRFVIVPVPSLLAFCCSFHPFLPYHPFSPLSCRDPVASTVLSLSFRVLLRPSSMNAPVYGCITSWNFREIVNDGSVGSLARRPNPPAPLLRLSLFHCSISSFTFFSPGSAVHYPRLCLPSSPCSSLLSGPTLLVSPLGELRVTMCRTDKP